MTTKIMTAADAIYLSAIERNGRTVCVAYSRAMRTDLSNSCDTCDNEDDRYVFVGETDSGSPWRVVMERHDAQPDNPEHLAYDFLAHRWVG